jgi:hypothetical protein
MRRVAIAARVQRRFLLGGFPALTFCCSLGDAKQRVNVDPARWLSEPNIISYHLSVLHFICAPLAAARVFAAENSSTDPASPVSSTSMEAADALLERAGVPRKMRTALQAALKTLDGKEFEYPWNGLEEAVAKLQERKLLLVGYGSLLNRDSAARTIKDTPREGHPPVLALGAWRFFNYVMSEALLKSYGGNFSPRERAALNVDYTRSPADALSLLTVAPADIAALRKREFGYDLRPVACVRLGEWEAEPFIAYVLVAAKGTRGDRQVIDNDALPHPLYAGLCRAGAHAVSEAFLQFYLATTFIADRKTSLAEWEKERPEVAQEPQLGGK